MIRHLLSHLQQFDILKVLDKVVSTALMAAAVAIQSTGLNYIMGDETQAYPVPTREPLVASGMPGAAPFQPWQVQSNRTQTSDEIHKAECRHMPRPGIQGKEKGWAYGPLENFPTSLKDSQEGSIAKLKTPTWSSPCPNPKCKRNQLKIKLRLCVCQSPLASSSSPVLVV